MNPLISPLQLLSNKPLVQADELTTVAISGFIVLMPGAYYRGVNGIMGELRSSVWAQLKIGESERKLYSATPAIG